MPAAAFANRRKAWLDCSSLEERLHRILSLKRSRAKLMSIAISISRLRAASLKA